MTLPAATHSPAPRTRRALALPLALTAVFMALGFISRARTNPHLAWTYGGVAAFLLCWQGVLFMRAGRNGSGLAWEFVAVRSHYVQALVQLSIYVYWGWYWRNVYEEAPLILSQVVFLYVFDGLLTWWRGQAWRLGFGPWPIIFSTNLFMWFRDDWFVFQFLMVAMGVLGKQFIRWRREGKGTHIFNPSALALTIVSLVLICTGNSGCTWGEQIALTQGRPPYLYLEIFLGGLVVQYFFSVTLLTFSAVVAIALVDFFYFHATGVYFFVTTNIPVAVFLGLHLLMTDPATTPRSSLGRIVFGGLYGLGVCAAFWVLEAIGLPSFYDKLVVVPMLNLLAPLLDRLAALSALGKLGRWESRAGPRAPNYTYMACWAAMFLLMLGAGFVEAPHPGATIGFWARAAQEKRPNATKNLMGLLADFEKQDLRDDSIPAGVVGAAGPQSREQSLGVLCNQVGTLYVQGKIVAADRAKACLYFDKACELGNPEGCANLAIQYVLLGRSEAEPYANRALAHLEAASASMTNARVYYILGCACDLGRGRAMDKTKARQFYEQGAVLGDVEACQKLGRMLLAGEGGSPDHTVAAHWLQKAADGRDGPSCLYLAKLYHTGDGVPRDEQRATALLEKACDLGVKPACELLKNK